MKQGLSSLVDLAKKIEANDLLMCEARYSEPYTIGDDNWLADWTGAEWLVNESSMLRLRDRVA